MYVTASELGEWIQLLDTQGNPITISSESNPSQRYLENIIHYAETLLELRTGKAWEPRTSTEMRTIQVLAGRFGAALHTVYAPLRDKTTGDGVRYRYGVAGEWRTYDNAVWDTQSNTIRIPEYRPNTFYEVTYHYGYDSPTEFEKQIIYKIAGLEMIRTSFRLGIIPSAAKQRAELVKDWRESIDRDVRTISRIAVV